MTMRSHVSNSLEYLLRAEAVEARNARRRLLFGLAFAGFLGGLLMAVGLAVVVLVTCLLIVVLVGSVSGARALRRNGPRLQHSTRSILSSLDAACRRSAAHAKRASLRFGHAGVAHASRIRLPARRVDAHHEALSLNVAGAKHRRSGEHAEAIELHRRALEILSDTNDLHAVALTQNNLALAMSHAGDDSAATELFEQAAATVRWLGDQEREARIMANLALAHRRHGRARECKDTLQLALTKVRPDSSAYRRIEAELDRVA